MFYLKRQNRVLVSNSFFKSRRVAQLVEHRSPKPGVAGSSPASPAFLMI